MIIIQLPFTHFTICLGDDFIITHVDYFVLFDSYLVFSPMAVSSPYGLNMFSQKTNNDGLEK